ncbi:MAG: hypothetical protein ACREB3_02890, partial [Burkholderiales bacterium]
MDGAEKMMQQADLTRAAPVQGQSGQSWWLAAPAWQEDIESHGSAIRASRCYRLGDVVLEVAVDDPVLLDAFQQYYGDCAVTEEGTPSVRSMRCT